MNSVRSKLLLSQFFRELLEWSDFHSTPDERRFNIGGAPVRVLFYGDELLSKLEPSISHLAVEIESANTGLRIRAFDEASASTKGPKLPLEITSQERDFPVGDQSQPVFYLQTETHLLAYQRQGGEVSELHLFDIAAAEGIYWVRDAFLMSVASPDSLAAPFRTLFSWFYASEKKVIIHAAGVGDSEGGVLFIGPGGSGKSNSSLACLDHGWRFAGDDSILIDVLGAPTAYSLYSSARLSREDLQRFKRFEAAVRFQDEESEEKIRLLLADEFPELLVNNFPIQAIFAPLIDRALEEPRVERLTPVEALRALAPSSILHIPGYSQHTLDYLSKLVSKVPSYRLFAGTREGIVKLVDSVIGRQKKRSS